MAGDTLARGARTAQFAAGESKKNDPIELKNVAAEDDPIRSSVDLAMDATENLPATPEEVLPNYQIVPLGTRIVVARLEAQETVVNGVVIPDVAQERPMEGLVVGVGPGEWVHGQFIDPGVIIGDRVLFGKYSGVEYKFPMGDLEYVILQREEVLARLVPLQVSQLVAGVDAQSVDEVVQPMRLNPGDTESLLEPVPPAPPAPGTFRQMD